MKNPPATGGFLVISVTQKTQIAIILMNLMAKSIHVTCSHLMLVEYLLLCQFPNWLVIKK